MDWMPHLWWGGYQLHMPGQDPQDLLKRGPNNGLAPSLTVDGHAVQFVATTKAFWSIGSVWPNWRTWPTGRATLFVISPEGDRYWLDWMVDRPARMIIQVPGAALQRKTVSMLVSRVEDRFGNRLDYTYDDVGNMVGIKASDGREVVLNYQRWRHRNLDYDSYRLQSVTTQPSGTRRTWTYAYAENPDSPRLQTVTLPDGSAWSYALDGFRPAAADHLSSTPHAKNL